MSAAPPASTLATPTASRPASWNPAVPPPPVTGADVGYGELVELTGDGDGLGLADGLADADGEWLALVLVLLLGVAAALPGARAVPEKSPVDDTEGEADPPARGDLGPEPVHAVIPSDTKITATTLAVRTPTKFPFPGPGCKKPTRGKIWIIGYASRTYAERPASVGQTKWRRVAGFRVVLSWPENGYSPPPQRGRGSWLSRLVAVGGVALIFFGVAAVAVVLISQVHAPRPPASAAGTIGAGRTAPLQRSVPVSLSIPAIGVRSALLRLGNNADGSMQVPSLRTSSQLAGWYEYSPTPGQIGASVIAGHVDGYSGAGVFFRLGAVRPGDRVDVRLADGVTAVFRVTGVRQYLKSRYPARVIYQAAGYAALRIITCGGEFDPATGHYLSSVVVYAVLTSGS